MAAVLASFEPPGAGAQPLPRAAAAARPGQPPQMGHLGPQAQPLATNIRPPSPAERARAASARRR